MLIVSDPPITLLLSPRNSNTLIIHFHATRYARRRLVMEVNNGRLAMISISGMVAQELVNGLNLIPADEVLEEGRGAALVQMGKQCAGAVDEAACAKAFEAAERVSVAAGK